MYLMGSFYRLLGETWCYTTIVLIGEYLDAPKSIFV